MPEIRRLVTQTGNDAETRVEIDTGINADSRSIWGIVGISAMWSDGAAVAAADYSLVAYVSTLDAAFSGTNVDYLPPITWGIQNTGGVAVAVAYEPFKSRSFFVSRATAQANLYLGVYSAGTAQANDVIITVHYEIIRATEMEILRMLVEGS
jgi:hypothetical protein